MIGKRVGALLLCIAIIGTIFAGCAKQDDENNTGENNEKKVTLKVASFSSTDADIFDEKDLVGAFKKKYPNVDLELELYKDAAEYNNAMKVRATANELPDVMYMKTYLFPQYKEYLLDLTGLEATKNNLFSETYKIDDQVYGLATVTGRTYVYYWTDLFEEAGVEVPETWGEFEEVAKKLKEYYTKDNPDFISLAIGAKDEWPTYPFMEFMPAAESGNGKLWNEMATQDEPFAEGTDIYKTYNKVYNLFSSGVSGKDPLGVGHDQVASLFAQKKAGMIAFAPTLLAKYKSDGVDLSTLSTFYLPSRDSKDEEFRTVIQGDNFLSVAKDSENQEIAKDFIEFFFSNDWYPDFINSKDDDVAISTYTKEKDPVLQAADDRQPDKVDVCYDGGNEDFYAIVSETKFDYKKLGTLFFIDEFDLDEELNRLNEVWKEARKTLNMQ